MVYLFCPEPLMHHQKKDFLNYFWYEYFCNLKKKRKKPRKPPIRNHHTRH